MNVEGIREDLEIPDFLVAAERPPLQERRRRGVRQKARNGVWVVTDGHLSTYLPSGHRLVELVTLGRKWVTVKYQGHRIRVPKRLWAGILR